jgi:hypothetical protein
MSLGVLSIIVCVAFAVEAALGFGATVIVVSLGARFVPVGALLPVFVPLNLALSLVLAVRHRRSVALGLLVRRVLPLMLLGMPLGMWLVRTLSETLTRRVLGALVVLLALTELSRLARGHREPSAPLPGWLGMVFLTMAGMVHGMFGAGGPLAVYVLGRTLPDKAGFRATLSALWFVLNALLLLGYAWEGVLSMASVRSTVTLVPSLVLGLALGEWLHGRVPERTFRVGVHAVLLGVGTMLLTKG